MRVRAIIEGRYAWRDEGPGNGAAGASGYHGSIVQGEPGAVERRTVVQRVYHAKVKAAAVVPA